MTKTSTSAGPAVVTPARCRETSGPASTRGRQAARPRPVPFLRAATGLLLSGLLMASPGIDAQGAETEPLALRPVEAGSFTLGSAHLLTFYVVRNGGCAITAVIEERIEDEPSSSPSRILFHLAPGERALVGNAAGQDLALVCGEKAQLLHLERGGTQPELAG